MLTRILCSVACIIMIFTGCGDQPNSPEQPKDYSAGSIEPPSEVAALLDEYAVTPNEVLQTEVSANLDSLPAELIDSCDVYAVTFLWGDLFNTAALDRDTIDWSGTLTIYNGEGVVHVQCEIDFEPGQDSVLIHNNPTFAIWISKTSMDFDGLSFLVFFKWKDLSAEYAPPVLRFRTEQITLQFSVYQLVKLDAYYHIDNIGGVAVHARRVWQNACPGGLINGHWIKDGSFSSSSTFDGWWLDHLGNRIGYLNGTFWRNENSIGEFSGQVSGIYTDQVIAELSGKWYYDDPRLCPMCGEGHGVFFGKFVYTNDGRSGRVEGEFGDYSLPPDDIEMPMTGIWYFLCTWTVMWNVGY